METLPELRKQCLNLNVVFLKTDSKQKLILKINNRIMITKTKEGDITPEQIAAWKKEHKKVHTLKVTVAEGDIAVAYLKPPSRNHKATALSMYSQNKVLECGEFLRDNCWLGGDERLKSDSDIADSAAIIASGIVKFLDGALGEA